MNVLGCRRAMDYRKHLRNRLLGAASLQNRFLRGRLHCFLYGEPHNFFPPKLTFLSERVVIRLSLDVHGQHRERSCTGLSEPDPVKASW